MGNYPNKTKSTEIFGEKSGKKSKTQTLEAEVTSNRGSILGMNDHVTELMLGLSSILFVNKSLSNLSTIVALEKNKSQLFRC